MNGLDEIRMEAVHHIEVIQQQQQMKWHDQYIKTKEFTMGDWTCYMTQGINISKVNSSLDG